MSNANFPQIHDYESASKYLGSKESRPCGNNTRIRRESNSRIGIYYHGNYIVEYFRSNETKLDYIILFNKGWFTITTKERLNHFTPNRFGIWQERGQWFVSDRDLHKTYPWNEGIVLSDDGVSNAGEESESERIKALTKSIKAYVNGFLSELADGKIKKPSSMDCFYCVMKEVESGKNIGELTHNGDHIMNHLDESYYVPSLLMNAIESHPVGELIRYYVGVSLGYVDDKKLSAYEKELMSTYVKRSMMTYIKHQLGIAS